MDVGTKVICPSGLTITDQKSILLGRVGEIDFDFRDDIIAPCLIVYWSGIGWVAHLESQLEIYSEQA